MDTDPCPSCFHAHAIEHVVARARAWLRGAQRGRTLPRGSMEWDEMGIGVGRGQLMLTASQPHGREGQGVMRGVRAPGTEREVESR